MSNNRYQDCPARMSDGRQFTDYRPGCEQQGYLEGHNSSYEYRQYLIHNAEKLMNQNRTNAMSAGGCLKGCKQPYHDGTMLPEKYVQTCTGQSCSVSLNNPSGVGIGRKYNNNYDSCQYIPFQDKAGANCCGDDKRPSEARVVEKDILAYQALPSNPIPFNLVK